MGDTSITAKLKTENEKYISFLVSRSKPGYLCMLSPSISELGRGNGVIVNKLQTASSGSIFKHTHLLSDKARQILLNLYTSLYRHIILKNEQGILAIISTAVSWTVSIYVSPTGINRGYGLIHCDNPFYQDQTVNIQKKISCCVRIVQ